MDKMISADRKCIAVAGRNPDGEIGIPVFTPVAIAGARP